MVASDSDRRKSKTIACQNIYISYYLLKKALKYRSTLAIWQGLEWPIILCAVCIVFNIQIWSVNFEMKRQNFFYISYMRHIHRKKKLSVLKKKKKKDWQTWTQISLSGPTNNLHFFWHIRICNAEFKNLIPSVVKWKHSISDRIIFFNLVFHWFSFWVYFCF